MFRVIPPRLNERLAVQKGVFLFPCDVDKSFEYNLYKTLEFPFDSLDSKNATQLNYDEFLVELNHIREKEDKYPKGLIPVVKINLLKDFKDDALLDLYRMNIDYASLFPGLDGFAKSLKMEFDSPISVKVNRPEVSDTDSGKNT